MATSELAIYPGAVLVVGADGTVREAHAGIDAPFDVANVVGQALHDVLELDGGAPEAGALQLWLACCDLATPELWRLARLDPPARLPAGMARPAVTLAYGPVLVDGRVTAAAVFVHRDDTRSRAEPPTGQDAADSSVAAFACAASDLLLQCDDALARVRGDRHARAAQQRLFRAVHTIKGEASAVGQRAVEAAAHDLEDHLAALREADRAPQLDDIDRIATGIARIRTSLAGIMAAADGRDALTAFHARARPLLMRLQRGFERWQTRARNRRYLCELDRMAAGLVELAERCRFEAWARRAREAAELIRGSGGGRRVSHCGIARIEQIIDQLDVALGLYQDLHLELKACGRLDEVIETLSAPPRPGDAAACAARVETLRRLGILSIARVYDADGGMLRPLLPLVIEDLPRLLAPVAPEIDAPLRGRTLERLAQAADALRPLLHDEASRDHAEHVRRALAECEADLSHVALDELTATLTRGVHEVGTALGKQVDADVQIATISVAPALRQHVASIAMHAIRNAVDHGIEPRDVRIGNGKPAAGQVRIRVGADDDRLSIEIADDGRGIDLDAVRRRAVERGLLCADDAARWRAEELVELVFHPGFSTATIVSEISGRGVGMDVIRATVEEMGGRVALQTRQGAGTRLRVDLPASAPW